MTSRFKLVILVGAALTVAASFMNVSQAQRARVFSHATPKHREGKFSDCGACHNLPTSNWVSAARGDKQKAFPDVRNFPSHTSCFGCHTRDIYSAGGAFCGTCHTVPTMRARAVSPFPVKSHPRQFDIIFPHDKHQDLIAENRPREMTFAPAHFVTTSFRADEKPKPTFYNCAICHQTAQSLPKFTARKVADQKPVAEAVADIFATPITAGFFKDSPNSHASCFQCHYKFQNLPVGKNNCSGCHAPATPYFEGKNLERYSLKFDHSVDGHAEKDCASCHIRITQNSDVRAMKDADVPISSCRSCHATQENEASRKILITEIDARETSIAEKKTAFQCNYCHTAAVGRLEIPLSHKNP